MTDACPISSWIVRKSTPASMSSEAVTQGVDFLSLHEHDPMGLLEGSRTEPEIVHAARDLLAARL